MDAPTHPLGVMYQSFGHGKDHLPFAVQLCDGPEVGSNHGCSVDT